MEEAVYFTIDDLVVEALASEVADLRGLPVEEALKEALELEVSRLRAKALPASTAG